jgi:hypothetical protein
MNSKEVFMNIYQILSSEQAISFPEDFDRELVVHVSRAAQGNISHITLEFAGIRAKFFSCLVFDGSGDLGTSLGNFAMPKMKLQLDQKAIILLTIIEYLIENNIIKANFEFFKARISDDLSGGVGPLIAKYDRVCKNSRDYIKSKEEGRKVHTAIAV